jgi:hypothetical protein
MSDGVEIGWGRGQSPEDLAAKFEEFDRRLEDNLEDAMDTVVKTIAAEASKKAPYETGWLSGHIRGIVIGWANEVLEGAVGTNVHYAPYQEKGNEEFDVPFDPNPYLQPALDENKDWAYEQYEQAVEETVEQVFG